MAMAMATATCYRGDADALPGRFARRGADGGADGGARARVTPETRMPDFRDLRGRHCVRGAGHVWMSHATRPTQWRGLGTRKSAMSDFPTLFRYDSDLLTFVRFS